MLENISVRQLTIGEIQDIMEDETKAVDSGSWEPDIVELLFPQRVPVKGILLSTGLEREKLKGMTQDEMDRLIKKVEDKNPFFAQMMIRLGSLTQNLKS